MARKSKKQMPSNKPMIDPAPWDRYFEEKEKPQEKSMPTETQYEMKKPISESGPVKKYLLSLIASAIISAAPVGAMTSVNTPEDVILSRGFTAYMDGKYKQAQSYFEEVIRINPKNSAAQKGLDKTSLKLKRMKRDEDAKNLALAKSKVKEGDRFLKSDDHVGAIDSYHAALDAAPDYPVAQKRAEKLKHRLEKELNRKKLNLSKWAFYRGVVAYLDRDWAKAYKIWSERSRIEPSNVSLSNATARAEKKFRMMMVNEREEFFRRGARAFYDQGLYQEAIHAWAEVLIIHDEDVEALEGKARSEDALMQAQGKNRDRRLHDLLEQGLEYYAQESWRKALDTFIQISQLDPEFSTAKEYISKLNNKLNSTVYSPATAGGGSSWRATQSSNANPTIDMPDELENFVQARAQLESQLKRDPSNIRVQQELDKVIRQQEEESERIYKDGLIAYSQGNRGLAIQHWKEVIVIQPEHKKALAALKKARAEQERLDDSPNP